MSKRKSDGKRYTKDGKLIQNTTIKVLLYPTEEQAALFDKTFGCCRYLWNQMLMDEERFYQETGEHFIPAPARYKKEAPFLREVDSGALSTVHQNLRQAFQRFFNNPESFRHPTYKTKKRNKNSYTIFCQYYRSGNGASIFLTGNGIRLPKVGIVKANLYRKPLHWWTLKTATISKSPSGKYYCSLMFEYTVREPATVEATPEKTLGLNYSIPHFYVDSNGHSADPPHWLKQSSEKLIRMQKRLARMERGSKNYQEQLLKIQRLHEHIANQRKDFVHQESRRIADNWNAVCVRDSNLNEMAQTLRLGNVMDSGFGRFRTCLQYKLERQGKQYIVTDKYFPSAKTCHTCGHVNDLLTPNDRVWVCPECGAINKRELNAAQNIRDRGLEQLRDQQ